MPVLGGLLVSLFSGLVAWLSQFLTRKVAYWGAIAITFGSLTSGLFLLMRTTLMTLSASISGVPLLFLQGVALAVPPIATACVSAYVTVWVAATCYRWQRDLLYLAASA